MVYLMPGVCTLVGMRPYGADVQVALGVAWAATNFICGKRLVPFLPELLPLLEHHGHLVLPEKTRAQLLSVSAATAGPPIIGQSTRTQWPRDLDHQTRQTAETSDPAAHVH